MLQNIRDNAQGWIAKIIIGLIVISFAFFGMESIVGGGQPTVAEVNGEEITQNQLSEAVALERNRRLRMMGDNIQPALLEQDVLREAALERLIEQTLLMQAADEAGVAISDASLDQIIVGMTQFQENGQFSPELFQRVLRSNGYSPAFFKRLLRTDLVISQLSNGVAASGFVTEKEVNELVSIVGQKRSFHYVTLAQAGMAESIDVSEEEIEQYYQENEAQFQTEERVKLSYIEIQREDFFEPVAEEDLREAYELEVEELEVPEERRASHILIAIDDDRDREQALERARDIREQIQSGEPFDTLAEEYSDDAGSAGNGGDLGYSAGDTFPDAFEDALFSLDLKAVSRPVLTDSGYHLIQVTDIRAGDKPAFADRRPIIEQRLQSAAAESEFVSTIESLRDLAFNSEGLTGPAEELDLTVATSGWISRSSDHSVLGNPRVLEQAFSEEVLQNGNNSRVIELNEDHFVVVHVLEHEKPHTRPLAEVRPMIESRLSRRKTTQALQEKADAIIAAVEDGQSLEAVAEPRGLEWQQEQGVTRSSMTANRELTAQVFSMAQPEENHTVDSVTLGNGDVAVVVLESVEPGQRADFSETEIMGIRAEIQRAKSSASSRQFVSSLREKADIEIL